ncbi:unnamed protein product [Chondrus crispus]|uniref:RING-type domain-containing protein n=1 Tax=Chondrus crispus TaxID=2769 RepID=R7QS17_CHOCR|nr:unnamed protein product [Chondrus crispus]CDF40180.1 unnamed protein product [Chondrus crispus]|eukprot:XP_005710474.1 unnamed protein product [Chondrus crispus]
MPWHPWPLEGPAAQPQPQLQPHFPAAPSLSPLSPFDGVVLLDNSPAASPHVTPEPRRAPSREAADVILLDTPPQQPAHPFPETILIEDSPRKRRRRDSGASSPMPPLSPPEITSPVIVVDDDDARSIPQPRRTPTFYQDSTASIAGYRAHRRRVARRTGPMPLPRRSFIAPDDVIATAAAGPRLRPLASPHDSYAVPTPSSHPAGPAALPPVSPRRSMPRIPSHRPGPALRQYDSATRAQMPPVNLANPRQAAPTLTARTRPRRASPSPNQFDFFPALDIFSNSNSQLSDPPMIASMTASLGPPETDWHDTAYDLPTTLTGASSDLQFERRLPAFYHAIHTFEESPQRPISDTSQSASSTVPLSNSNAAGPSPASVRASLRSADYRHRAARHIAVRAMQQSALRPQRSYGGLAARGLSHTNRSLGAAGPSELQSRLPGASSTRNSVESGVRHAIREVRNASYLLETTDSARNRRRGTRSRSVETRSTLGFDFLREGHASDSAGRPRRSNDPFISRRGRGRRGSQSPFFASHHTVPFVATVEWALQGDRLDYENLIRLDEQLMRDKNRADTSQIDSLPMQKATTADKEIRCCVCMCDVEEGEELRVLPCSHKYHKKCIDEWLTYNGCCPVDKKRIAPPRSRRRCPAHSG